MNRKLVKILLINPRFNYWLGKAIPKLYS